MVYFKFLVVNQILVVLQYSSSNFIFFKAVNSKLLTFTYIYIYTRCIVVAALYCLLLFIFIFTQDPKALADAVVGGGTSKNICTY